eukprot:COSAG01_NODE_2262_length_8049_cov_29.953213_4_plen_98_part_00
MPPSKAVGRNSYQLVAQPILMETGAQGEPSIITSKWGYSDPNCGFITPDTTTEPAHDDEGQLALEGMMARLGFHKQQQQRLSIFLFFYLHVFIVEAP